MLRGILGIAALPFIVAGCRARADSGTAFFDMHAHPVVNLRAAPMPPAGSLLAVMDTHGIERTVLSPPPVTRGEGSGATYGTAELAQLVAQAPGRLGFSGGGDSLNPMLQRLSANAVSIEALNAFRSKALAIVEAGAVCFAELGAEVLAAGKGMPGGHDHQTTPADHPLLLALAEIAAQSGVPIGLHMEAITGGPTENISAMERLLASRREARIVWLHAGWDRTGQRSVALMGELLQRHSNLFMTIKSDRLGDPANSPLGGTGRLQPAWLAMLQAFPDRFVIGSDQFYDRERDRIDSVRRIVDAMPEDLARQIGRDNPAKIYRLRG
jgi:hypothetical protein